MVWYAELGLYLWLMFKDWLVSLIVMPFRYPKLLWILAPIWLSWFFAEFFQEKKGTSMGNATSNATVVLWGAVDWTKQSVALISEKLISGFLNISFRVMLISAIFAYGTFIAVLGIKGNKLIKKIGRVREVTYFIAVYTPIFYGVTPLTFRFFLGSLAFFPLFYYLIELIDKITPNPKPIIEDKEEGKTEDLGLGPSTGIGPGPESGLGSNLGDLDLGKGKGNFKL